MKYTFDDNGLSNFKAFDEKSWVIENLGSLEKAHSSNWPIYGNIFNFKDGVSMAQKLTFNQDFERQPDVSNNISKSDDLKTNIITLDSAPSCFNQSQEASFMIKYEVWDFID